MADPKSPASVSFFNPTTPEQALQQYDIQRRIQMAQQLVQSSQQPDSTQMVGPIAIKQSPIAGLAKMLGQGLGNYQYQQATKDAAQLQGQQYQALAGLLGAGGTSPGNATGGTPGISDPSSNLIQAAFMAGGPTAASEAALKLQLARMTPDMANANASGQPNPLAYENALDKNKQNNIVTDRTVNGVGGVPMRNEDALNLARQLSPQPPVQPPQMPMADMSGAPRNPNPGPPPLPAQGGLQPGMPAPSPAPVVADALPSADVQARQPSIQDPNAITPPAIGNDPRYAAQVEVNKAGAEKLAQDNATNSAEDRKVFNIMKSGIPMQMKRFQDMEANANNASAGYGVEQDGTGFKQNLWNSLPAGKTSAANNALEQLSAQGVLGELGPQLAQSGAKGNKFLESIANSASALKMNAPPEDKVKLVNGLRDMWVSNLKATASRLRDQGHRDIPSDQEIDQMIGASGAQNKAQWITPPSGIKYRMVQ